MVDFVPPDYSKITFDTDVYINLSILFSHDHLNYLNRLRKKEPVISDYVSEIIGDNDLVMTQPVLEEYGIKIVKIIADYKLRKKSVDLVRSFMRSAPSIVYDLDKTKYSNSLGADIKEQTDNAISIVCGTNGIGNLGTCNVPDFINAFIRIGMPKSYQLFKVFRNLKNSELIIWNASNNANNNANTNQKQNIGESLAVKMINYIKLMFGS